MNDKTSRGINVKYMALLVATMALSACRAITNEGVQKALQNCESHGGLKILHPGNQFAAGSYEAVCADGLLIEDKGGTPNG